MISRIAIVILAFILSANKAFSLSNTISEQPNTGKVSPKRPLIATGLSVVLPGAGQIYNKQYWKPPLFWASMAGGAYLYHSQHKLYKSFSNAYDLKSNYLKNPTLSSDPYPQHSIEYLETWRNRHKLLRNVGLFTLGAGYMVNVVDAYASAQTHHNPRAATFMSALLPGSGQIYNRKYWKLPIIYGGFGALIYFSQVNHKYFLKYRDMYEQKIASQNNAEIPDPEPLASPEAILREREYWRRNRDLNYIGIGLLYVLNVIDANVDAHLAEFDVSDDLSMKISPTIAPYSITNTSTSKATGYYGATVSIRF